MKIEEATQEMNKRFISENELMLDGFRLGVKIFESGYRPTFIVGLWRGGSSVGIVVQECLQTLGVHTDHLSLRTSYQGRPEYEENFRAARPIRVHGTQYLLETLNAEDQLLIVDDVFSSGRHTRAVVDLLRTRTKRNMPAEVRVAAPWFRTSSAGGARPDYFIHETSDWLVLPYELTGLTPEEIARHKPYVQRLLNG
jgi:hypoxanthine phosphoribosyltransferase